MTHAPIDLFRPTLSPEAGPAIARLFKPDDSGRIYIGQGPQVELFERAFASVTGLTTPYPLGMISCTAAIDLALHMIGVGPGDEVITTPITCSATNGSIVTRGASIVWADVNPHLGTIDPVSVRHLLTPRVKAIIAVDWGGRSCAYDLLHDAASWRRPSPPIIQDAAHRLYIDPAQRGDYVAWSFGPIKHLTCGGYGGALLPPADQYARAKLLRWHGLDRESKADFRCSQDITEVGFRYHLTDDLATVGLCNLGKACAAVAIAREHAAHYTARLRNLPGIELLPMDAQCDYWFYTLLADDRDALSAHLSSERIGNSQVHARNDKHTAFRAATARQDGELPGVSAFDRRQLAIPVGWWVTDDEIEIVAETIRSWAFEKAAARQPVGAAGV